VNLFHRLVLENGGVLYRPESSEVKILGSPPPKQLIHELHRLKVSSLSVGRVMVATRQPHGSAVIEVIRNLGLDHHVIFNRAAVMVLPRGIDKGMGFKVALSELELLPSTVLGIGDAENDLGFLELCGCSVAVANALPSVRERVDIVTEGRNGKGVGEILNLWLRNHRHEKTQ
jgi:HAD superfamily hydrolase (TIGR01484 family)